MFLSDKFELLVIMGDCHIRPPWRNRLARSAVNRKVGGSSPPGGDVNFFFFKYHQAVMAEKPALLGIFIMQLAKVSYDTVIYLRGKVALASQYSLTLG